MMAKTFQDLVVWQKAHPFVLAVYRLSQTFPRSETYGLTSQFRRAAVSIAANIAEGFKRVNTMKCLYPEGIKSLSPGLRGTSYPGNTNILFFSLALRDTSGERAGERGSILALKTPQGEKS